jgi:hypothetical protein
LLRVVISRNVMDEFITLLLWGGNYACDGNRT